MSRFGVDDTFFYPHKVFFTMEKTFSSLFYAHNFLVVAKPQLFDMNG